MAWVTLLPEPDLGLPASLGLLHYLTQIDWQVLPKGRERFFLDERAGRGFYGIFRR